MGCQNKIVGGGRGKELFCSDYVLIVKIKNGFLTNDIFRANTNKKTIKRAFTRQEQVLLLLVLYVGKKAVLRLQHLRISESRGVARGLDYQDSIGFKQIKTYPDGPTRVRQVFKDVEHDNSIKARWFQLMML
jgi:hypothetical protein